MYALYSMMGTPVHKTKARTPTMLRRHTPSQNSSYGSLPSTGQSNEFSDTPTTDDAGTDIIESPPFIPHNTIITPPCRAWAHRLDPRLAELNNAHHNRLNVSNLRTAGSSENEIRSLPVSGNRTMDNIGPFNAIEFVSITVIILLIISLFIYHCHNASKNIENNLNENRHYNDRRRSSKSMRRRHSFSKSSSFASNLASVIEEPEIFDTRLADELNKTDLEKQKAENANKSPSFLEPWYKWLQHDSPKSRAQQIDKMHGSENDIIKEREINEIIQEPNVIVKHTSIQIIRNQKFENTPIDSYLISVTTRNKCDEDREIPRSLSHDSYF